MNDLIKQSIWLQSVGAKVATLGESKLSSSSSREKKDGDILITLGHSIQYTAHAIQTVLLKEHRKLSQQSEHIDLHALESWLQYVRKLFHSISKKRS
ncbi:hypothetical protein [Mechercharimyces sp. CAU 1602]|uniref:hypothetical protein n=1 Tax=Mechercharimyces sp. CAU 1602 TaxID=2973933 RepID=UPI0021634A67|nr:hypothetical protein [Mechercharimyces sp. CAU 1602]MCS1352065.1 hypothetical protein [Mechercharimyces sp. CAU 1602]